MNNEINLIVTSDSNIRFGALPSQGTEPRFDEVVVHYLEFRDFVKTVALQTGYRTSETANEVIVMEDFLAWLAVPHIEKKMVLEKRIEALEQWEARAAGLPGMEGLLDTPPPHGDNTP